MRREPFGGEGFDSPVTSGSGSRTRTRDGTRVAASWIGLILGLLLGFGVGSSIVSAEHAAISTENAAD